MLESELFALFERTADAAYAVTEGGDIVFWSAAAERLFGYAAGEVTGRDVEDVLDARDALGTRALARGHEAAARRADDPHEGIPNFDLSVRTRAGDRVWVNVSTIVFDNDRTGRRLLVRLARDVTARRRTEDLLVRAMAIGRQLASLGYDDPTDHAPVERLTPRERTVLTLLARGLSADAIATELGISPQTLRNHLHRVNRKLRTRNRLEAVAHARRRGLIE